MGGDGVEIELVIPAGPAATPTVAEPTRPAPAPAPGGLPHTGVDVLSVVLLAAILIALGVLLARHRPISRRSS